MVWWCTSYDITGMFIAIPAAIITFSVAGLMVSRIRYYSFKQVDLKGRVSFFVTVILVFVLAAVAINPPQMLFIIFLAYACSGPMMTLWQLRQVKRAAKNRKNRT